MIAVSATVPPYPGFDTSRARAIEDAYRHGSPIEYKGSSYYVLSQAPVAGGGYRYLLVPINEVNDFV